jgi:threonine/homoserine/homoserine lactone efflux protein
MVGRTQETGRVMGQAIGDSLPLAIGVAVSPIPIIAIILMLLSKRSGTNSASFLIGWVLGIAIVLSVVVAVAGTATLNTSTGPEAGVSWIKVILGILLLLVGLRDWRKRPKGDEEPTLPKWLTAIEGITPVKSAGLGLLLSAVNPKNLLLLVAAGVAIAQEAPTTGDKAVAMIIFIVIAISTVALPVILNATMGSRAKDLLDSINTWLKLNNATVMAVLLLVIGFVLIGKGIGGFG